MVKSLIHPTAIIESGAQIGDNVQIEAYVVIKKNVVVKDNVIIKSQVYLDGHTTIGEGTVIWPFSSIGTKTQDLKYRGETTFVLIGKHCEIREFTTINSSTKEGAMVRVGDHCLIMACCHIAHNCTVGNHVIVSNNSVIAGHVVIEDFAVIGGMSGVHQFVRIGCHAMVGGMSRVLLDVPPFTIGSGNFYRLGGINRVGLKRHQFSFETRKALTRAYRIVYCSRLRLFDALKKVELEVPLLPEVRHFIDFCRATKRGLVGSPKGALRRLKKGMEEEEEVKDRDLSTGFFEDQVIRIGS